MSRVLAERLGNRFFGDFVEHHAVDRHFGLQQFVQVPANRFPFAVFVRRQEEFARLFEQLLSAW